MAWLDTLLVIIILVLTILILWSKMMNQKVLDTVLEIKEILKNINPVGKQ